MTACNCPFTPPANLPKAATTPTESEGAGVDARDLIKPSARPKAEARLLPWLSSSFATRTASDAANAPAAPGPAATILPSAKT